VELQWKWAQARHIGGGRILAKRGLKNVHTVIPNGREWLVVLLCVNATHTHTHTHTFLTYRFSKEKGWNEFSWSTKEK